MSEIYFMILALIAGNLAIAIWRKNVNEEDELKTVSKVKIYGNIAAIVIVIVYILCNSIYTKSDQQTGFVNTLGKNTIIEGNGIKLKMPFISKEHLFPGTTQSMTIGYVEVSEGSEEYEVTTNESLMITADYNFIETDFYIEYQISNPIEYFYGSDDPINILRDCAITAIKNNVGLTKVDDVMTTGKALLETKITDSLREEMANHELGITLGRISLQDVDVPTVEVKKAFDKVESAKQKAVERENEAKKYRNEQIPAAEADAAAIIAQAEAAKTVRINQANSEVSKFQALWEMTQNSEVVREKIYYDTLVEILPSMDIIISDDSKIVYISKSKEDVIDEITN